MTVNLNTFNDILKECWLGPSKVKFKFRTYWSCSQHASPQYHSVEVHSCGCTECDYHEDWVRVWECDECEKSKYITDESTMQAVYISSLEEHMNSELLLLRRLENTWNHEL